MRIKESAFINLAKYFHKKKGRRKMRVQYDVMAKEFERVLAKKGFSPEAAKNAAVIFAQNSLAVVYSHGLNRFPRVVSYL